MEASLNNVVMLEIEGSVITCKLSDLIAHSDYFKAMFKGNFVESCKNIIPLNGIELVAMKTILKLLWDREYIIEEENLLSVLQAACMLQFLEIKETCIRRVEEILSVKNCLKIWLYAEYLDLKAVHLKAKFLALVEFMSVKDTDYFLELSLGEIMNYLGSVNLQCSDELVVFRALIKWYHNVSNKNDDFILKLLHCLDFTKLSQADIHNMIAELEIERNQQILNILHCVLAIKNNHNLSTFEEYSIQKAHSLLKSKSRNVEGFPCTLVDNVRTNQQKMTPGDTTVFYYDKFRRKRKYSMLEYCTNSDLSVVCIDVKMSVLKNLFDIDSEKAANLDGFKMIGYKQFIYLYGGEYHLGRGNWNRTFYMFDLIKEKWIQKDSLPCARRHFESCICGNYLFIVGGTGPFRVIRENIFWYNLSDESWSEEVELPCYGRQLKCCPFDDKLFVLNINNKCGYSFNPDSKTWTKLDICDSNNVLPYYSEILSVFSYKSSLYIKECKLLELKLQENRLVIVREIVLMNVEKNSCQVESVLCNNMLYSLNKQFYKESNEEVIFLESFNVDTFETSYIFQNTSDDDNETFKFRPSLVIFNVLHQNLVDGNDLVNDFV